MAKELEIDINLRKSILNSFKSGAESPLIKMGRFSTSDRKESDSSSYTGYKGPLIDLKSS
jgi:nitrogenase molybdenum-iron protein alpha/beta subunit